jgi:hypothetical protein
VPLKRRWEIYFKTYREVYGMILLYRNPKRHIVEIVDIMKRYFFIQIQDKPIHWPWSLFVAIVNINGSIVDRLSSILQQRIVIGLDA